MKVWIIGSEGMLGSTFHRYLSERDVILFASDRREVDITNYESIERFASQHPSDIWINCAGYTQVDMAEDEPLKAFEINAKGVENLALCAKKESEKGTSVKLIHFSTDYVFGGDSPIPYKEEDETSPINVYGESKLEGEKKLSKIHSNHLIFRLSWLFGITGHNFVKSMLHLMQTKEILHIVDDQIGIPTFCQDVVEIVWSLQKERGLYHLSNKDPVSWHGFAQEIARQAHLMGAPLKAQLIEPISSMNYPHKAKRPSYSVFDTHKIESLGVELRSWQEALSSCLQSLIHQHS